VKAVWVKARGRRPEVARVETARLPPDAREHREMLRSWIKKVGLQNSSCVLGLSGQHCMFQSVLLHPGDMRPLGQAASMEVLQFNEMAQETMVYGFAPVQVNPGEKRFLLAMARPSVLEGMLGLASDIGVRAADLAPLPAALHGWAAACSPHPEPRLYLNVGFSCTELAVGTSESLMFARAFGSGGQMFTEAYARAAGIAAAQADAAKIRDGSMAGGSAFAQPMRAAAEVWLAELQSCLSVFRSAYGDRRNQPSKVVLSGRGAQLAGFREFIAERTGLPVEWLAAGCGLESPELYAAAAGLAWTGAGREVSPLSLLPPEVRHELLFRKQKPYWIGAGVAASLILGVSLAGGYMDFKRKEALLQTQKTSLSRRQELAGDIEAVEKGTAAMLSMAEPVQRMAGAGPLIRDLLAALAARLQPGDWIVMVSDSDSYFSFQPPTDPTARKRGMRDVRRQDPRLAAQAQAKAQGQAPRFIVEGCTRTRSLTTVKTLIADLEKEDFVEKADLLSDDQLIGESAVNAADPSDMGIKRFVVDIRVKQP